MFVYLIVQSFVIGCLMRLYLSHPVPLRGNVVGEAISGCHISLTLFQHFEVKEYDDVSINSILNDDSKTDRVSCQLFGYKGEGNYNHSKNILYMQRNGQTQTAHPGSISPDVGATDVSSSMLTSTIQCLCGSPAQDKVNRNFLLKSPISTGKPITVYYLQYLNDFMNQNIYMTLIPAS